MSTKKICILDYGSGNVRSVYNMLLTLTKNVKISNNKNDLIKSTHIILPGVGAFGASMSKINNKLPLKILGDQILLKKKPFLGICVGMQVLADKGLEFGEHKGLGWIHGDVLKLNSRKLPVPHIGWNNIKIIKKCILTERFSEEPDFYFVHSYFFQVKNKKDVIAETAYGENFSSIINCENIYGVQFHPEKSQKAGKTLLENFINI